MCMVDGIYVTSADKANEDERSKSGGGSEVL